MRSVKEERLNSELCYSLSQYNREYMTRNETLQPGLVGVTEMSYERQLTASQSATVGLISIQESMA